MRARASIACLCAVALVFGSMPASPQVFSTDRLRDLTKRASDLRDKDDEEQQELGESMAATLLGAASLSEDRRQQEYVARVGHWVARNSSRPDMKWRFGVLDDDTINAFAAPAGHVFITRGLLLQLNSEAELAGVLAHEIAHVTREHHLKAIKTAAGMQLAGEAIGFVRDRRGRSQRSGRSAAVEERLIGATRELYSRGLDRGDEHEADMWALTYMARAGYDPFAYAAVLQWLDAQSADDSQVALLFTTHPDPASRLEHISPLLTGQYSDVGGVNLAGRFVESLTGGE